MNITFEPSSETTQTLFNKELFQIPRYQRSYSWKDNQLEEFEEDFLATKEDKAIFFGTIVLDKASTKSVMIIDGQQRLLTLTITFAVIRDILEEDISTNEARDLAKKIQLAFIERGITFDEESVSYRITPSKDLGKMFEQYVQKGDKNLRSKVTPDGKYESHKNVINAYNKLRTYITKNKLPEKLSSGEKVALLNKLVKELGKIQFIKIDVYDGDLAYMIFESHNSKGADLLVSDLVKNHLYEQLRVGEPEKEKYMAEWDELIMRLKANTNVKIDKFLHYYMQTYEGRFPKSVLFKKIKERIKTHQPTRVLKEMKQCVDIFVSLKSADVLQLENSPIRNAQIARELNRSLEGIDSFNVDQCYILLISLFRNASKLSPTYLVKTTQLIENFTFRFSRISQGQANVLEKIYTEFATKLNPKAADPPDVFGGRFYSLLKRQFEELDLGKNVFMAKFVELDYSKKISKKINTVHFQKNRDRKKPWRHRAFYTSKHRSHFSSKPPSERKSSCINTSDRQFSPN